MSPSSRICAGTLLIAVSFTGMMFSAPLLNAYNDQQNSMLGNKLADMLRAGRSVVSANQALINDPEMGDKGFTGAKLVNEAEALYLERSGEPPVSESSGAREAALLTAQRRAMAATVDAHQTDINKRGVAFKGFIPAVFARLANEEFEDLIGQDARIRVTAPRHLVRNRKARPDDWEREILEEKMILADWPVGQPYTEFVEYEGRKAYRMLLPEYYTKSCLSCHGGPVGELDVTGYPKEGGKVGELAGAISIVLFE